MAVNEILWLGTGFLALGCFAARFLIRWIMSERVRRNLILLSRTGKYQTGLSHS